MKKQATETTTYPKILLLSVQTPNNRLIDFDSYMNEFRNLAKANGICNIVELQIRLRSMDPGYFLTKGKREEVKKFCDEENVEEVVISEPLTSRQVGNLKELFNCKVFDRSELILEIFEKSAHTAEGKLQVEIAMLQHKKSRLAGKGVHFGQQAGGIGVRGGFGETAKEKETRHIEDTILQLQRQLARMHKARETQRKSRLINQEPTFCLIGYTNAGKSTILNLLTKSKVLAEDKLFATLDTTTRELYLDGVKKGVISDTVGFIQQLPPRLIAAFKSTLSELHHAHLLLHIIDVSDSNWQMHIKVVHEILHDLGVSIPMLYVFNKADKCENIDSLSEQLAQYQPHVVISALSKETVKPLITYLTTWNPLNKKESDLS